MFTTFSLPQQPLLHTLDSLALRRSDAERYLIEHTISSENQRGLPLLNFHWPTSRTLMVL